MWGRRRRSIRPICSVAPFAGTSTRVSPTGPWCTRGDPSRHVRSRWRGRCPTGRCTSTFRSATRWSAAAGPLPDARDDGSPWTTVPSVASEPVPIASVAGTRVLIVAGAGSDPSLSDGGWPVLADARSRLGGPSVVTHADAFLRHATTAKSLVPDAIVRVGPPPASRVVNEWLDAQDVPHIVLSSVVARSGSPRHHDLVRFTGPPRVRHRSAVVETVAIGRRGRGSRHHRLPERIRPAHRAGHGPLGAGRAAAGLTVDRRFVHAGT